MSFSNKRANLMHFVRPSQYSQLQLQVNRKMPQVQVDETSNRKSGQDANNLQVNPSVNYTLWSAVYGFLLKKL